MTIPQFRAIVHASIQHTLDYFDNGWFTVDASQTLTTAFSGKLTCALAPEKGNRFLLAAPRNTVTNYFNTVVADANMEWERREWMIDFVVEVRETDTFSRPLIGCESEAWNSYDVGHGFEAQVGGQPRNGYLWDFKKLIFFQAPRLLFVARVNKPEAQLPELQQSLAQCAIEHAEYWPKREVFLCLLPSGKTQKRFAGIAVWRDQTPTPFEPLYP